MVLYFLLAFITIPLIEIVVFILIGDLIGLWWTLAVVIATALGGTAMLRNQGIAVLFRAKDHLEKGKMPLREVFDGVCLLIAGALLLTPGFVTDVAGGLLILPFVRTLLGHTIKRHVIASGALQGYAFQKPREHNADQGPKYGDIIDGDFEEVPPESINSDCEEGENTRNS